MALLYPRSERTNSIPYSVKNITFATYDKAPNLTPDDATALLPLNDFGIAVTPVIWNDPSCNWQTYDAIILRSCWDYHQKLDDFRRWLDHITALQIPLWNPMEIVHWNLHKKYLQDLAGPGLSTPRTIWLNAGSSAQLQTLLQDYGLAQAVVKPAVSATAWQTWRTSPANAQHDQTRLDELLKFSDVMIQEFIPEVTISGEWSLLFLGGEFSHAVVKRPQTGDFRVQSDFGGTYHAETPPPELIKQAENILHKMNHPLLYARVDGVVRNGDFVLMELELIEPQLFLELHPLAPQRFASAIAAIL